MRVDLSPRHSLARLRATLADLADAPGNAGIELHRLPLVPPGQASAYPALVALALGTPPGVITPQGVLVLVPLEAEGSMILRSGDVAWARFVDGAGAWVMDTDAGLEGGDAVVQLASLTLRAGGRCPMLSAVLG